MASKTICPITNRRKFKGDSPKKTFMILANVISKSANDHSILQLNGTVLVGAALNRLSKMHW